MKLYNLLIIGMTMLFLGSCGNAFVTEDYYDLEELPGYVAFDADGNNATIDPFAVSEDGTAIPITIENPTGTLSDIKVDYALSGTAVYGTDYTIAGASAGGGSVTISSNRGAVNETFRTIIPVVIINNEIFDENPRSIIITLTGASHADGPLAVGRGGTDLLKEATINIADDECDSQYAGSYNVVTTIDSVVVNGMLDTLPESMRTLMSTAEVAKDSDFFTYNVDDASGGLYASDFFGGSSLPLTFTEDCGAISLPAQTDFTGQNIILLSGSVGADGVITLTLKGEDRGDQFTSVFTPI